VVEFVLFNNGEKVVKKYVTLVVFCLFSIISISSYAAKTETTATITIINTTSENFWQDPQVIVQNGKEIGSPPRPAAATKEGPSKSTLQFKFSGEYMGAQVNFAGWFTGIFLDIAFHTDTSQYIVRCESFNLGTTKPSGHCGVTDFTHGPDNTITGTITISD